MLSTVAGVYAGHEVNHKPKPQNSSVSEKTPEQINKIEAKTAANTTESDIKHTWEKANRTEVGGTVENMTLV